MAAEIGTRDRALIEAASLAQRLGFNGFSFQHVADALGIKKPSLYVHFESKEDLGLRLIERYAESFAAWTKTVAVFEPAAQVGALFEMFFGFANDDRKLCTFGALSSDYNSLPPSMQKALSKTMKAHLAWLQEIVARGQKAGEFRRDLSSSALAKMAYACGLGTQKLARVARDPDLLREAKASALLAPR